MEEEKAKRAFVVYLMDYVIINVFLASANLYISPGYLWFPLVLVCRDISPAFYSIFSRLRFAVQD